MSVLKNLVKKEKISVIVVTHESEVASYTDRTILISDGEIKSDKLNK